jgi:DNA-binding SARP family transcriptional activator
MRRISIRLLGPFEVTIDGALVTSFAYAKVRALLAYLAVERQHPHPRAQLATLLWPDQSERTARASLSQALTTLRTALDDKRADRPLLLADAQHVQLDLDASIELDVVQFLACLRAADAHGHHSWRTCPSCAERSQQALDFYRGSFLADVPIADSDVFEEWATLQREHLHQRALSALERLVERAQWRGAYIEALSYAQRLVALEPLLEEHQRACMRLLALNGESSAALAHYRQLRTLLAQELAVEPEQATTELFDQIRRSDTADMQPALPPFD